MYVAPMRHPAEPGSPHLDEAKLLREGYFGSYRARLGWGSGRRPPRTGDELFELSLVGPRLLDASTERTETTTTREDAA